MSTSADVLQDVQVYADNLQGLAWAPDEGGLDADEILSMLSYRDAIQDAMEQGLLSPTNIFRVTWLDEILRRYASVIVRQIDLAAIRRRSSPSITHWWWFLDEMPREPFRLVFPELATAAC
ncbi:MAG: hypothetical protein H8D78_05040 [Chloroflexi bacterium]|nr:hypothetical protein [Chloroflexota bacterium]